MEQKLRHIVRVSLSALALVAGLAASGQVMAQTLIRDSEIERTLHLMADPIFQAAGFRRDEIDIYIISDRSLNAFVANGANMFLFTGLLQTLETPEELMSVIAHETGHIAGGHESRRQVNLRGVRGPALIGVLAGIAAGALGGPEVGSAIIAGSQGAAVRTFLKYSRAEEASADQAALKYLARVGVSPVGMRDVLARFRGQEVFNSGSQDPFVLTHPLSTERMQLIDRAVEAAAGQSYPKDPNRAYWHGRMRAKLTGFLDDPTQVLDRIEGQAETEEVLYQKAVALYRKPDLENALAATDRLIALRPDDPYYIELKGQILFENGNPEAAVPLYRRAAQFAPGDSLIESGLGRALLALDRPEADAEALKVLQNAHSHDLADATGLRSLATAYARAGDEGMASLATAERYALGGDIEDAQIHARRAVAVLPEGSPGWLRAQDILGLKTD